MNPISDDLLLELIETVQEGISRRGFHILSKDDIRLLCPQNGKRGDWMRRVEQFAEACGAKCELDREMKSARFLCSAVRQPQPALAITPQIWNNEEWAFEGLTVLAATA